MSKKSINLTSLIKLQKASEMILLNTVVSRNEITEIRKVDGRRMTLKGVKRDKI